MYIIKKNKARQNFVASNLFFMKNFKEFLKAGHAPTLFSAFLYFDFCFAIWVLNGAMAPFISETFHLSAAEKGFMISVPILAGAIMRFPLGILAQYIGRKNAALVEMSLIFMAMCYGYFSVKTYNDVLIMGVMLGIAGASFGVALSLGSGWFPPKYKGLAMGISGAGNSGTVLAVLLAPPLAAKYGWQTVYGFAAMFMLIPILVMLIFAKEPPDREHQSLKQHLACLFEKDGWAFNLVYIITFGGFIGLSNFLPTYFYDNFHVSKIEAGQLTMFAALMGSVIRIVGGWASDRFGGIYTLFAVFAMIIILLPIVGLAATPIMATILFMFCFAALGAGNGALFQLVPHRWPTTTAVAGSMIGEIGALGGSIIPNAMGLSFKYTNSYFSGFLGYTILAIIVFFVFYIAQKSWTKQWCEPGGKPKVKAQFNAIKMVKDVSEKISTQVSSTLKSIIYPVGNSQLAEKAGAKAAELAKATNSKLVLLYVEEKWHAAGQLQPQSEDFKQIRDTWIQEGKRVLSQESERLNKLGFYDIEQELRHGDVAQEIVEVSEERKAEMIILASHQYSPLGSLLMGSRTLDVFKKAQCPILRIVR